MPQALRTSARAAQEPSVDTSSWLTRDQAVDLLGVSAVTLANWERRGLLHPRKALAGKTLRAVYVYDPDELARLPVSRTRAGLRTLSAGEITSAAFRMFEEGRSIRAVVIELRVTVPEAEDLRAQWIECGGVDLAITPDAKAALEQHLGPFATLADLLARVRERLPQGSPAPANTEAP